LEALYDDIPDAVKDFGILSSNIIVQEGGTSLETNSLYKILFPISAPEEHNDLGGIDGGTAGEYYHLTFDEYNGSATSNIDADKWDGQDSTATFKAADTHLLNGKPYTAFVSTAGDTMSGTLISPVSIISSATLLGNIYMGTNDIEFGIASRILRLSNNVLELVNNTSGGGVSLHANDEMNFNAGSYNFQNASVSFGDYGILSIDWANSDDGAGSELDADKLDGQEGSYYLSDTANSIGHYHIENSTIQVADIDLSSVTLSKLTNDAGFVTGSSVAVTYIPTDTGSAVGDIMYYDGSKWVALSSGTANQFLKTGAVPSWDTPVGAGDCTKADDEVITGDWKFNNNQTTFTAIVVEGDANFSDSNSTVTVAGYMSVNGFNSRIRATRVIAQTIPNATWTKVEFNTEIYDGIGEYNTSSATFTATNTGYYAVVAAFAAGNAAWESGEIWKIGLFKNGSQVTEGYVWRSLSAGTWPAYSNLSDHIYLEAGNYIDIRVYHNRGGDTPSLAVL